MTFPTPGLAQVGDSLPELRFGPVTRGMLALYAGASGDHNPIHIDLDFAKAAGQSDVFAHGMLSFGVLSRVVTQWCGAARLREFGARFVSLTHVGDVIVCAGEIAERLDRDGEALLRVIITATTADGRQTLSGEALVANS